ncbi:MAG: hypothetical protein ACP5G1_03270 [Nanopusillaceae archaeon]
MIYIQGIGIDKIANLRAFDIVKDKYKFDKIVFVCSKDSIDYIPKEAKPNDIIIIEDENNIKEIIDKLVQRFNNVNDDFIVNITTGTKAIVSALTLFSYIKNGKIIYIGGKREGEKVITGSERIYEYDIRQIK